MVRRATGIAGSVVFTCSVTVCGSGHRATAGALFYTTLGIMPRMQQGGGCDAALILAMEAGTGRARPPGTGGIWIARTRVMETP